MAAPRLSHCGSVRRWLTQAPVASVSDINPSRHQRLNERRDLPDDALLVHVDADDVVGVLEDDAAYRAAQLALQNGDIVERAGVVLSRMNHQRRMSDV